MPSREVADTRKTGMGHMAIEFTSLGKPPTPNGNLLVVDGLNLAFRWKHQKKEFFKVEYLRTIESLAKSYGCGRNSST